MQATTVLRQAAAARQPLIKFMGKRTIPASIDHSPQPHPASPTHQLPDSFVTYRAKAQQHGPLNTTYRPFSSIGASSGAALGPVTPKKGEYFDRNDLPARFRRAPWSQAEIDAIETGGASMFA
ncbi:Ribosomal protein YMR-31, mitochondrial [Trichophyton interdigitale]|nr:Ribosomal protein YMR-31, mitochondrial [Trichophyton interdigitale]KAG5218242.1 Ribosomal protein YMR-31, mitochondrial [Trichophyton interdigitale]KAG8206004.1 Ribosomal protein YMR-31, mitochondrial [Trichophyton interdigitale]